MERTRTTYGQNVLVFGLPSGGHHLALFKVEIKIVNFFQQFTASKNSLLISSRALEMHCFQPLHIVRL